MIAQLGEAGFERAKKTGEILAVLDESTKETYWVHKTLEISTKDEVRQGTRASGNHSMTDQEFRNTQACNNTTP